MGKLTISSPLTFSDWMLKEKVNLEWGEEGVREVLEKCKRFGFSRIYWRVFDAGRATYKSSLMEPNSCVNNVGLINHFSYKYGDYLPPEMYRRLSLIGSREFDELEAAVRIGHELGLEIYAWMTINEEDHGFGFVSKFSREHPEYRWVSRNGQRFHSQISYAFEDVRAYKLALVREMLAYDIDGLFMDWIRVGDTRDAQKCDEDGVVNYGYEQPNVDLYKARYGIDPFTMPNDDEPWIRLRAEPQTAFMRAVRAAADNHSKRLPILAMTFHPWAYRGILPENINENTPYLHKRMGGHRIYGSLPGLLCDIRAWAEEGLIDAAVAAGYYCDGGAPEMAVDYMRKEVAGKAAVHGYFWTPGGGFESGQFVRDAERARKMGVDEMLLWEADYIDNIPDDKLETAIEEVRGSTAG